MTQLHTKVKVYLGRNYADSEVELQTDDGKTKIIFWSDSLEKTKPTDAQLDALSSQAETLEKNEKAIGNRLNEYPSIGDVIDAIFKKEAGDSSEFNALATSRQTTKNKYSKE
jgi:hypothetical protein